MPEEMGVQNTEGKCENVGVGNNGTDEGERPKTPRHILRCKGTTSYMLPKRI